MTHDELTPAERQALARECMQDRIRAGMKAMLEEILEEESNDGGGPLRQHVLEDRVVLRL